jgi:hypothetical protein
MAAVADLRQLVNLWDPGKYSLNFLSAPDIPAGDEVLSIPILGDDSELQRLFGDGLRFAVHGIGGVASPGVPQHMFFRLKGIGVVVLDAHRTPAASI